MKPHLNVTVHQAFPFRVVKVEKAWYEIYEGERRHRVIFRNGDTVQIDTETLNRAKEICRQLRKENQLREAYRHGSDD